MSKELGLLEEAGCFYSHKEQDGLVPVEYTLVSLHDGAKYPRKIWVMNIKKVSDLFRLWNRSQFWKVEG